MYRLLFVIVLMMSIPVDATTPQPGSGSEGWTSIEILQRADDLAGNERFKEAAYLYRRFLTENPEHAAAVFGLARCVERLEGPGEARELFEQAFALDPSLEEAKRSIEESSLPGGEVESAAEPPVLNPSPITTEEMVPSEGVVPSQAQAEPATEIQEAPVAQGATVSAGPDEVGTSPEPLHEADSAEATGPESGLISSGNDRVDGEPAEIPVVTGPEAEQVAEGVDSTLVIGALVFVVLILGAVLILAWRRRRDCTVRGMVEQFPLADLLQWLSLGQKEGHLKVTVGTGHGHVYLKKGSLYRAEFAGSKGEKAVYGILSLSRGHFVFREESIPEGLEQNLDVPVPQILMRWACATDEANRDTLDDGAVSLDAIDDSTLNVDLPF